MRRYIHFIKINVGDYKPNFAFIFQLISTIRCYLSHIVGLGALFSRSSKWIDQVNGLIK